MGKKIEIKILDRNTIELLEDAKAGDYIDLTDTLKVDLTPIEEAIKLAKDEIYKKELNSEKEKLISSLSLKHSNNLHEKENEYNALKGKYEKLENEIEYKIKEAKLEIINAKDKEIASLNDKLSINKADFNSQINEIITRKDNEIEKLKIEIKNIKDNFDINTQNKVNEEKEKFNIQINTLNNEKTKLENQIELEKLKLEKDLKDNFELEKAKLIDSINELKEQNSHLSLQKSALNIKKLGENLEKRCDNEFESARVYGFSNATWSKDNDAIKEEGDLKGTKADYIFRVYLSMDDKKESNVISSVCCEMKNESNVSVNKKKNSDHFKKLDDDRRKKNCEYALLISELERDTDNDAPIRKINEYDKMYMVRPQYMINFLSLVYSLSMKYKDIILEKQKEREDFLATTDIINEFNNFKDTYLNKPLKTLSDKVEKISKNNEAIKKANDDNIQMINEITTNTFQMMKDKIERFDIKKITRKIDKLEKDD